MLILCIWLTIVMLPTGNAALAIDLFCLGGVGWLSSPFYSWLFVSLVHSGPIVAFREQPFCLFLWLSPVDPSTVLSCGSWLPIRTLVVCFTGCLRLILSAAIVAAFIVQFVFCSGTPGTEATQCFVPRSILS
jgi:hypothetical protein